MKSKAIIYARLSREDEEKFTRNKSESRSIENQIKVLSEYAQKHEMEIYKVFYDDGISGGTFDRPGLNNLLKEMKKGAFNVLLLKSIVLVKSDSNFIFSVYVTSLSKNILPSLSSTPAAKSVISSQL